MQPQLAVTGFCSRSAGCCSLSYQGMSRLYCRIINAWSIRWLPGSLAGRCGFRSIRCRAKRALIKALITWLERSSEGVFMLSFLFFLFLLFSGSRQDFTNVVLSWVTKGKKREAMRAQSAPRSNEPSNQRAECGQILFNRNAPAIFLLSFSSGNRDALCCRRKRPTKSDLDPQCG